MKSPPKPGSRLVATRNSLIERLGDWEDRAKWQEFFDTYWRLIYGVARKSGLTDSEAQDVVQETIITVAREIPKFKYDAQQGSFKGWLLQTTRWRVADQFRKRAPDAAERLRRPDDESGTAEIEKIADSGAGVESLWDEAWERNLLEAAIERVKAQAEPKEFQIFDLQV